MTLAVLAAAAAAAPWTITSSVTLPRETRMVRAASEDPRDAVLVIRGDGITVDFNRLTLRGSEPTAEPDQRKGVGIRVEGKNVTIRNARVHGFKVGLYAEDAPGLKIIDSDFSYNWKQRLLSTLEREDLSDWMSFHQNEKNEWLRFGAGVYLLRCDGARIERVRVQGGQCGLMITQTNRAVIVNNDFSFLSAVGLGMYRSSDNLIQQNKIDWCVRGYSHGVYNRGQDSTGILIYEQSHRNIFAYNSVTHGGDGFFLWAGQTTMDTGQGGCNDNLLIGNDFSHAPTNGIEATFSRNTMVNNLMLECWHGAWLGYSYESLVWKNVFGLNAEAIAWEHGQDNLIADNRFHRDTTGILLWQKTSEDPNWGYPKHRDTASRDNIIRGNRFTDVASLVLGLRNTKKVTLDGNTIERAGRLLTKDDLAEPPVWKNNTLRVTLPVLEEAKLGPGVTAEPSQVHAPLPAVMQPSGNVILGKDPALADYLARFQVEWNPWLSGRELGAMPAMPGEVPAQPGRLRRGLDPFLKPGTLRGRRYILVDQWGPYDFKSPLLWPRSRSVEEDEEVIEFEILGPKGKWSLAGILGAGVTVSEEAGDVPGRITARFPVGSNRLALPLEYRGQKTVDYRGVEAPARRPVAFGFSEFRVPIAWEVRHFNYDKTTEDPRTAYDAWKARGASASAPRKATTLNENWWRSPAAGINPDHFGTLAEGSFSVEPGEYELNVTSDDGVRVWIDGKMVLENWTYHGPTLDTARVKLSGRHAIRVEHFDLDGFSCLKVSFAPVAR